MLTSLLSLAALSREAYGDHPVDRREYFGKRACAGFVQQMDGHVVIAFRGTDAVEDWLTNLDVGTAYVLGVGAVHEGFAEALESELEGIDYAMAKLGLAPYWNGDRTMQPIVCTGHSLGGALAVLMAGRLQRRAACAVTFGCPRIVSRWTEPNPALQVWGVIHGYDVVPRLPRIGFQPVGEQLYWGCNRVSRFLWRPFVKGMLDHKISRYIEHAMEHSQDNRSLFFADDRFSLSQMGDQQS